jgi:hypothetical protein
MNSQPKPRRLIILSLIAILASVLSFTSLPTPTRAANAKGEVLIARAQYDTYDRPISDYTLLAMDAAGNTRTMQNPVSLPQRGGLPFFGAGPLIYAFFAPPNRIEVINLTQGTDTLYPLPPVLIAESAKDKAEQINFGLDSMILINNWQELMFNTNMVNTTFYLLNLGSGAYSVVNVIPLRDFYYGLIGQSPADGKIYAAVGAQREGVPGVVRFDLRGNQEEVNLDTGKYEPASRVSISLAGRYLYFTAQDPEQPVPLVNGPGFYPNVIMRYRISNGTSSVIVRAAPGNIIGSFDLSSDDPYITYTEGVPGSNYNPYSPGARMQQWLIKRVNLATHSGPEQMFTSGNDLYGMVWCGSTFYYETYIANQYSIHSYSPSTHRTAQAEGQLLGCAP